MVAIETKATQNMNTTSEKKKQAGSSPVKSRPGTFRKPSTRTVSAMRDALAGKGLKTFPDVQSLIACIGQ